MRHTITLYRSAQAWMSVNSDPKVRDLFGTDVLPTAFPAAADESTVLARIQALNPDCDVVIDHRRTGRELVQAAKDAGIATVWNENPAYYHDEG